MGTDIQDSVTRIVRLLLTFREMTSRDLGAAIGLAEQRMSDRMNGRSKFSLAEVARMADALDVDPGVWFDEPENALQYLRDGGFRTGSSSSALEPVAA